MNKDDVIRKARALLEFKEDRGCTTNEVKVASEKLQKLMDQYNISLIELQEEVYNEYDVEYAEVITEVQDVNSWMWKLAEEVAKCFQAKAFFRKDEHGHIVFAFVGAGANADVAGYYFNYLRRAFVRQANTEWGVERARIASGTTITYYFYNKATTQADFVCSFIIGAINSVKWRLRNDLGQCTALVSYNSALVEEYIAREISIVENKKLDDFRIDEDVEQQGKSYGRNIPLNEALE